MTRRHVWRRRAALLALGLTGALSTPAVAQVGPAGGMPAGGSDRLVILVRHAEKAAEPRADPPLTETGRARAEALAATLADAGLDAVIVTPFERTRATAAPVLAAHRLTAIEIAVGQDLPSHIEAVAHAVRARPAGETILVVGHSNTIPAIVTALGGPILSDLCDDEYAALFVLTLPVEGRARLVRAAYGAADLPDAGGCHAATPGPS